MRCTTGAGAVRRQPKDSFLPPTPLNLPRDSDASLASSRPSNVGVPTFDLYKERSYQQSAISTVNSFLSSHNFPVTFRTTSPSAKDIHETLRFLLSVIDFPTSKVEDDLPLLLKHLNYPFKLNKSILKSPAAPHQWPSILALIHWLVQLSRFHLSSSSSSSSPLHDSNNVLFHYTLNSYLHFIHGDDDAVYDLDRKIRDKILHEKALALDKLDAARRNAEELEAELERLRSAPSQREVLEKEKSLLEDDVNKFHKIIDEFASRIEAAEKVMEEKERQLEAKVAEKERISEENEELRRRVELQTFNARDVERMRRELQAAERDTGEAELARNTWEEKCWELDNTLSHKFKDIEALAMDCNQSLKRSSLTVITTCIVLHYQLN